MNRLPEILAPAGSPEALRAAVRCGADAVYLGASAFNARQGAHNFDTAALREAVSYCHARGVAVHLTLNTLVRQEELPPLELCRRFLGELDAAKEEILQDVIRTVQEGGGE